MSGLSFEQREAALTKAVGIAPGETKRIDISDLTPFDFTVQNEGSLFILHPCNDAARGWIEDNLYDSTDPDFAPQWWGGGVVIEPRYAGGIVRGIEAEGLTVG